ncbi:DNA-3-methyladenine glycosylase [Candidatus Poribacteria bacterium]|nr:DNA-3-methyladenine glycosylase [Candidatus Poribacteria bacterium]MCH2574585.1 DNA-3-methyladenine glycosylase 2 family protein [Candidatus Poribacteria bacterium]|tara:strand:- start:508 stop:1137 length:630 start_codon:yes stop_codon:yes gene_type:complete
MKSQKLIPDYWTEAKVELSTRDPILADIISRNHDYTLSSRGDLFRTLIRSIVGQQISVKSAAATWCKFENKVKRITPRDILLIPMNELKKCGLSLRKVEYILGISRLWNSKYSNLDWFQMTDQEVIDRLLILKGVGKWTAEMVLIFTLMRPDIFPVGDISLVRSIEEKYNDKEKLSQSKLLSIGESWKPWRTVATCFIWYNDDPEPVEY